MNDHERVLVLVWGAALCCLVYATILSIRLDFRLTELEMRIRGGTEEVFYIKTEYMPYDGADPCIIYEPCYASLPGRIFPTDCSKAKEWKVTNFGAAGLPDDIGEQIWQSAIAAKSLRLPFPRRSRSDVRESD